MSAPDVQSVLCVGSSETSNNRDIGLNLSPSFSRKYTKYANYTPWPTPCEVAVEMQTMASCEHLAAATQGWAAFDWAEHCLKQERRINEGDCMRALYLATVANRVMPAPTPRSCRRSSTLRSESGKRTYSITAKRMISGLVLKYLNGECFVIRRGYETALPRLKLDLSDSTNERAIGLQERASSGNIEDIV